MAPSLEILPKDFAMDRRWGSFAQLYIRILMNGGVL